MNVRSLVKRTVTETFKTMGIDAVFVRKNQRRDLIVFNRNYLARYYKENPFRDLYVEAMTKTNSESRDSFEKQCRYYGLYQMVGRVLVENIAGKFAECGCWRGHSAYMTAQLISKAGQKRDLYLFDSFEGGLSDKSEEDKGLLATVDPDAVRREKEAFYSTEKEVSEALLPFDFVTLYKGWIPDRFTEVKDKIFSLINLDLDLYQPIKDSLDFFYPRLSKGGVIIVDDYGTTDWPGVTKAVDGFLEHHSVTFAIETLGSMIILK
jgi:O-methyltransferase